MVTGTTLKPARYGVLVDYRIWNAKTGMWGKQVNQVKVVVPIHLDNQHLRNWLRFVIAEDLLSIPPNNVRIEKWM